MQARDVKCWIPEAPTECLVSGLRVVRGSPCTAPVSGCWHALTQQSQLHGHMVSRWHIWLMDASLTARNDSMGASLSPSYLASLSPSYHVKRVVTVMLCIREHSIGSDCEPHNIS